MKPAQAWLPGLAVFLVILLSAIPAQIATSADKTPLRAGAIPDALEYFIPNIAMTIVPGVMILIPAGDFSMGCDAAHNAGEICRPGETPVHTVTLDAYRIDRYEVTNAQYAQCVAVGACSAPWSSSSYTHSSYYDNPAYANFPVIWVDWNQSAAFCAWAGRRLPGEAEWEKATRGPVMHTFPWGDAAFTCGLANFRQYGGQYCVGDTSAVGSYPAGGSPYGVMDMAGNVSEWVNDWYDPTYYAASPGSNPPGPADGTEKVLRGSTWIDYGHTLRVALRASYPPAVRTYNLGFRCAAAP